MLHKAKQASYNLKWNDNHGGRTKVVEAPWGQPLREVGGKQETGEKGKEEVVTVTGQSFARAAASPTTQKNLHTQKNVLT